MKYFSLIILLSVLTACGSMDAMDNTSPENIRKVIKPGDLINVETLNKIKHEIVVESISKKSIKGKNIEIPLDQIESIIIEETLFFKTINVVFSVIAVGIWMNYTGYGTLF